MNECDRKMKGVEASRDRVERELIRMQGGIVGKGEYEGEMKEMKRKMHSLESKADLYHSQKMTILYENLFPRDGEAHDAKAKGDITKLIGLMYERAR